MKLQIEASVESFLAMQSPEFYFISNASKPNIDTIFYPSESLFAGLLTRLILTTVIGLIFLFMAVAGMVVVNSGKIKNPTVIPIYVFSGIGALLLVWAYQTYQKYEQTREIVKNAPKFNNDFREGLYFLEKGIIYRQKKKVTTIPYKSIHKVKFSRRSIKGGFSINEYTFDLNTGEKFKIDQSLYDVSAVQIHKHFKENNIKVI